MTWYPRGALPRIRFATVCVRLAHFVWRICVGAHRTYSTDRTYTLCRVTEIAIIGGGIGGLTTAIALRQFGINCQVFEQAPELLDVGAAIAVWPNATRVLAKLNLLERVLAESGAMREIRWLHSDGSLINRISLSCFDLETAPAIALHRANLQHILLEALPEDAVKLGHEFVAFHAPGTTLDVEFAKGASVSCDFLIGADGIHS